MANIDGTNAKDIIDGTLVADVIRGFAGDDILFGDKGPDRLLGGAGHDTLIGDNAADLLIGGAGEDRLIGGAGNDTLDGTDTPQEASEGSGFDYADYSDEGGGFGVIVHLGAGTATDSFGHTDTLIDIEVAIGTALADSLTGGNPDNFEDFRGLAGNDIIDGGAGTDRATYSSDIFYGGNMGVAVNLAAGTARDGFGDTDTLISIENVRGTVFSDELIGNGFNNRIEPMGGGDIIDGGGGTDTVSYQNDHFFQQNGNGIVGIRADLSIGQIVDTSGYAIDSVVRIENVTGSIYGDEIRGDGGVNDLRGGAGDDYLAGARNNDRLDGGTGQDILRGGRGNDTLDGGSGDDALFGGGGADLFVFRPGHDFDVVRGFDDGIDRIDVRDFGYGSAADVLALASSSGNDTIIQNEDDQIRLNNFDLADLDAGDFLI